MDGAKLMKANLDQADFTDTDMEKTPHDHTHRRAPAVPWRTG